MSSILDDLISEFSFATDIVDDIDEASEWLAPKVILLICLEGFLVNFVIILFMQKIKESLLKIKEIDNYDTENESL